MAKTFEQVIAEILLELRGHAFADELNIKIAQNTPSPFLRLLCASLLFSTRIRSQVKTLHEG